MSASSVRALPVLGVVEVVALAWVVTLDYETRHAQGEDARSWTVVACAVEVTRSLPLCLGRRLSIESVLDSLRAMLSARATGGRAMFSRFVGFVVAIATVIALHSAVSSVGGPSTWVVCLAVLETACSEFPW